MKLMDVLCGVLLCYGYINDSMFVMRVSARFLFDMLIIGGLRVLQRGKFNDIDGIQLFP